MTYGIENRRKSILGKFPVLGLLLVSLFAIFVAVAAWLVIRSISEDYARYSLYDPLIREAAFRNGVDPLLLKAVIWRESRFQRDARGSKGEIGLMQIMPRFAAKEWMQYNGIEELCNGVLSDPALNIEIGSWYLGRALRKWSDYKEAVSLALCEYNAGQKRANAWRPLSYDGSVLDRIDIASTLSYVNTINAKYEVYKKESLPSASKGLLP